MKTASEYDYSQGEIKGKFKEDFLYYKNGGPWYLVGIRATQLQWRDLTAEGNRETVIATLPIFLTVRGNSNKVSPASSKRDE